MITDKLLKILFWDKKKYKNINKIQFNKEFKEFASNL